MKTVYLGGPIAGLNYRGATGWRNYAKNELRMRQLHGVSPLRDCASLLGVECFSKTNQVEGRMSPMATPAAVFRQNRFDAMRADLMLVNLLGAKDVSIGTCMEMAWANARDIPIVLVMEDAGNPHEHTLVLGVSGWRVPVLEDALDITIALLNG